jgi:hypothetical protein
MVFLIGSTGIKILGVIANIGGLVNSPFLFAVVGNQAGLSSLLYLSGTRLINVVYPLAPVLLISVVRAVVSVALFCILDVLSGGNLRGKHSSLSVYGFLNGCPYFASPCLIRLERSCFSVH